MSTRITVRRRGPYVIEGDCEIVDVDGKPIDLGGRPKVLLCRCGASAQRPLCDGAHHRVTFAPEDDARERE